MFVRGDGGESPGQEPSHANRELRVVGLSTHSDKTLMRQAEDAVAVGSC